jgi:hypothetical protein
MTGNHLIRIPNYQKAKPLIAKKKNGPEKFYETAISTNHNIIDGLWPIRVLLKQIYKK